MNTDDVLKRYPKVFVEWEDIITSPVWQEMENINDNRCLICNSIGYLKTIDRENNIIILMHTINANSQADSTVIPIGCIKRIRRMRFSDSDIIV